MVDRDEIARLIPHAGTMCLIDRVASWDEKKIICETSSHKAADNPLRANGMMGAACGVEYAAQAMAIHGGLTQAAGSKRPKGGFLVSLRSLTLNLRRLDVLAGDLTIEAERLAGEESRVSYAFSLTCDGAAVLSGRAAVLLDMEAT